MGLAGAQAQPVYQVWLHDWRVEQTGPGVYRLYAAQDGFSVDLTLRDAKGLVLEGDQGYSQKGPEPGNASYYVSQTRLHSTARSRCRAGFRGERVELDGPRVQHQRLEPGPGGLGLVLHPAGRRQRADGLCLAAEDGSIDPFSSGTLIFEDGDTRTLTADEFSIEATEQWTSPHSGAVYPAGWVIRVPGEGLELTVEPLLADQEWLGSFVYWEGAVKVEGRWGQDAVSGFGYGELTGYGQSMEERF